MELSPAGRAVRVNADGDLVLLAQLVETVEAVLRRIGAEHFQAERLAELEDALVGVVVLREALHAPGERRHLVVLAQRQERLDGFGLVGHGTVVLEELAVSQAELLHLLQRLLDAELAEGVALGSQLEAPERIICFFVRGPQAGRDGEGESGGPCPEKLTTVEMCHVG